MSILLSIKPEFAELILAGEKRFEFRRRVPQRDVERVVVYASSPVCRLVGEFTIRRVITAHPKELWRLARSHAGITQRYFDAYFKGRDEAHAFEVESVVRYDEPIDPKSLRQGFRPPQSFLYLDSLKGFERRLRSAACDNRQSPSGPGDPARWRERTRASGAPGQEVDGLPGEKRRDRPDPVRP